MTIRLVSTLLLLLFLSCGTKITSDDTGNPKSVLPVYTECGEIPKVYEKVKPIDHLINNPKISFHHLYNSINIRGDSTIREQTRKTNANLARITFKSVFPEFNILNDSLVANKSYSYVHLTTAYIYSNLPYLTNLTDAYLDPRTGRRMIDKPWPDLIRKSEEAIQNLTVANATPLQLFIELRTYIRDNSYTNNMKIYVFNQRNLKISYYHELEYYCDIRDKDAFVKVLKYAFDNLKTSLD